MIHRKTISSKSQERKEAACQLEDNYPSLPDKSEAWSDLICLTRDKKKYVREAAVDAIGSVFAYVPDKSAAWSDLIRLIYEEGSSFRWRAANALSLAFPQVLDKSKAWSDLIHLTQDKNKYVRMAAADALGSIFVHVPYKFGAWSDLHRLTCDEDVDVKFWAASALGIAFPHIPDQSAAWSDLHRLMSDQDSGVRWSAVDALGSAFAYVPDKSAAWSDLHRLTRDEDEDVRMSAAYALDSAFSYLPEKSKALSVIIHLTCDKSADVQTGAVEVLGSIFAYVPDKAAVWPDLHRLTRDEDCSMRWSAADALGLAFPHVPDKVAAWSDLHRLASDEDSAVRARAAGAIGLAFAYVPDKSAAWSDLHLMTRDEYIYVRRDAAYSLGSAFLHIPDKSAAWSDLVLLTRDKERDVRASANYSLGKISIFKATESENEDDFRRVLEKALEFFGKSASEAKFFNPVKFCFPFYRSFYVLTCKRESTGAEVETYLRAAKKASQGSKSKKELLEAVENLANALREVQRLHEMNFEGVKSDLKTYMQYCNRAVELLNGTEDRAPGATKLIRKGLPIIDRRIKETIAEIQEKARAICQLTRGTETPFEPLGTELNRQARRLSDGDYLKSARSCLRMSKIVKDLCRLLPQDKCGLACEIIGEISRDNDLGDNLSKLETALAYIQPNIEMEAYEGKIIQKLDNIIYNISRIKISSADSADSLRALKWELDRIKAVRSDVDGLGSKVEGLEFSQQRVLQELKAEMPRIVEELETLAKAREVYDKKYQRILDELQILRSSPEETILHQVGSLASIVGLFLGMIAL